MTESAPAGDQAPTVDRPTVAAAVITHEGRVLLGRRSVEEGSLVWQFPAGEVEADEPTEDAAVRETAEETGLIVAPVETLGERVHPSTGRRMVYVACRVIAGEAEVSEELAEIAWCGLDELPTYVPRGFFAPVQQHLDEVLAGA